MLHFTGLDNGSNEQEIPAPPTPEPPVSDADVGDIVTFDLETTSLG